MQMIASSTIYKNYKNYKSYKAKIIKPGPSGIESEVLEEVYKTKEDAIKAAKAEIALRETVGVK